MFVGLYTPEDTIMFVAYILGGLPMGSSLRNSVASGMVRQDEKGVSETNMVFKHIGFHRNTVFFY